MKIDVAELYRGLEYGTGRGAGGAGLFRESLAGKTRDTIRDDPLTASYRDFIAREAGEYRRRDIPSLPFSLYRLYEDRGDRARFEDRYFERRRRLVALALAFWFWERPEDRSALEDCIWALCDEYSWCLPAHMDGTALGPGEAADRGVLLDLFACETGFALAECCAMLEGMLAPQVVRRARDETCRRVIQSYRRFAGLWKWELMDNNWCAVCAGSIGGAAMYLVEDDRLLAALLQRLAPALSRFIAGFSGDGVCMEGLSYWTYGLSFYTAFGDLLCRRTGGNVNILNDPAFARIAAFQQACYFPCGGILNFSDASGGDMFRLGLSCYLAARIPSVEVPRFPYRRELSEAGEAEAGTAEKMEAEAGQGTGKALIDHCGRFAPALRDFIWASGDVPLTDEGVRESVFPQAQWLLCAGEGGTGFAAKGGHNGEPHNHNDVGNFIFYKNGRMAFCDLGAGEYTKDYFSDKRYTIFCTRSESHSVPVIGGRGQEAGKEFGARNCVISSGGSMILDIAGAYGINGLSKLERRFSFDAHGGTLTLEDSFAFFGPALPVLERFVSPYLPQVEDGGVYIDTGKGRCVLKGPGPVPLIQEVRYRDHDGKDAAVFTIDFPFEPTKSAFSVVFTIG